jgi:hypothetical protein
VFSSDTIATTTGALNTQWYKTLAKGASGWTAPTSTTAGTTILTDNGTSNPFLNATTSGAGRAYALLNDPANGVKAVYVDSAGSLTTIAGTPLSTASRGGFGTLSVDSLGNIHCVYGTIDSTDAVFAAGFAYYNGTSWTNTAASSAVNTLNITGVWGWSWGAAAIRVNGDALPQTATGTVVGGSIYDSPVALAPYYAPRNIYIMP